MPDIVLENSTPFLAFPLANLKVLSNDFIKELENDADIGLNDDGIYTIFFTSDSFIQSKEDLFPRMSFGLPVPILDSVVALPVPAISELNLSKGILKGDQLIFLFNSSENTDVTLTVSLPNLSLGGEPYRANYIIPFDGAAPSSLTTEPLDLNGYEVDFTEKVLTLRYDARRADGERIVLPLSFAQISAFDFSYLEGSINRTSIPTGLQRIEIDIQDTLIEGDYQFQNPKIHFDIANNFGIPIGIKVKEVFVVGSDLQQHPLVSDLFEDIIRLDYPGFDQKGEVITDRFSFDKTNSNLLDLAQNDIVAIDYDLDIIINPENTPDVQFFVLDSSRAVITAEVELGFEATIEVVRIEKTVAIQLGDLDSLSFLRLKVVIENGLPLSFDPQLVLEDSLTGAQLPLSESSGQMIESATTDDSGNILESSQNVLFYQISEDQIIQAVSMNRLKIELSLKSPNGGRIPAIIKPGQMMEIRIGAEVKLK
ncbi:MAG: hypothetical protein IPL46_27170 [Saprospiraceae bacterium]|nr:hypothetical protein [Saprospiraceae bacterium]